MYLQYLCESMLQSSSHSTQARALQLALSVRALALDSNGKFLHPFLLQHFCPAKQYVLRVLL